MEDHYQIVEYSEITKETAELRHVNGQLIYNAANICNHYFTVDFLKDVAHLYEKDLLLHVAKKKISYVNDDGERIISKIPNGIKIEKFVFDVFPFAKNFAVWQGTREAMPEELVAQLPWIDRVIEAYEHRFGPHLGAAVVAQA